ncbi:hypothetical protein G7046_g9125 [Stylonectria norvegica]|nr:hypothetical protein G7046_g9125 [Stylonectria norvegica]
MSKEASERAPPDEELPPPYSYSPEVSSPLTQESRVPASSLFSSHLSNLPLRILSAQAARTTARDQRDSETLALLVPPIEELLSLIAAMDPPPSSVEMTLVPENAVGEDWKFSDEDDVRSVVRVRGNTKATGDKKVAYETLPEAPREKGFDEWGRWKDDDESSSTAQDSLLWWSDGDMARRLAEYLQPVQVDRRAVKAHMEQAKEVKKSGRWSLFKKPEPPAQAPIPSRAPPKDEDEVTMTAKAEEVTFRRENALGVWEGRTGWGVVIRVNIRR